MLHISGHLAVRSRSTFIITYSYIRIPRPSSHSTDNPKHIIHRIFPENLKMESHVDPPHLRSHNPEFDYNISLDRSSEDDDEDDENLTTVHHDVGEIEHYNDTASSGSDEREHERDHDHDTIHSAASPSSRSSISSIPDTASIFMPSTLRAKQSIKPRPSHTSRSSYDGAGAAGYLDVLRPQSPSAESSVSSPKYKLSTTYTSPSTAAKAKAKNAKLMNVLRDQTSPFRHASSVVAMQMRDHETDVGHGYGFDDDDESIAEESFRSSPKSLRRDITPRQAPSHSSSRLSGVSSRSGLDGRVSPFATTPTRRLGARTRTPQPRPPSQHEDVEGTSVKKAPKKEYPLVLLHCTILPPTLPLPSHVDSVPDDALLKEVLPETYYRRWKMLDDRVGKSTVIRERGVLMAHPREMYGLLEERLLESLELEKIESRVRNGHYLPDDSDDSSDELESDEEKDGNCATHAGLDQPEGCPDCGKKISRKKKSDTIAKKKWEVRFFAANGLMRADAWAAAWKEMEKVDVEVGVWLPEDVKRRLEERCREVSELALVRRESRALSPYPVQFSPEPSVLGERSEQESPGRTQGIVESIEAVDAHNFRPSPATPEPPTQSQDEIDGLVDPPRFVDETPLPPPQNFHAPSPSPTPSWQVPPSPVPTSYHQAYPLVEQDLSTLFAAYIRRLTADTKNVVIFFMALLVLSLALAGGTQDVGARSDVVGQTAATSASVSAMETTMDPAMMQMWKEWMMEREREKEREGVKMMARSESVIIEEEKTNPVQDALRVSGLESDADVASEKTAESVGVEADHSDLLRDHLNAAVDIDDTGVSLEHQDPENF